MDGRVRLGKGWRIRVGGKRMFCLSDEEMRLRCCTMIYRIPWNEKNAIHTLTFRIHEKLYGSYKNEINLIPNMTLLIRDKLHRSYEK